MRALFRTNAGFKTSFIIIKVLVNFNFFAVNLPLLGTTAYSQGWWNSFTTSYVINLKQLIVFVEPGFFSWYGQGNISSPYWHLSPPAPNQWMPRARANHSPPSSVNVKNAWSYTSTSYNLITYCLINDNENFISISDKLNEEKVQQVKKVSTKQFITNNNVIRQYSSWNQKEH
jgi:hypothetical protein